MIHIIYYWVEKLISIKMSCEVLSIYLFQEPVIPLKLKTLKLTCKRGLKDVTSVDAGIQDIVLQEPGSCPIVLKVL